MWLGETQACLAVLVACQAYNTPSVEPLNAIFLRLYSIIRVQRVGCGGSIFQRLSKIHPPNPVWLDASSTRTNSVRLGSTINKRPYGLLLWFSSCPILPVYSKVLKCSEVFKYYVSRLKIKKGLMQYLKTSEVRYGSGTPFALSTDAKPLPKGFWWNFEV